MMLEDGNIVYLPSPAAPPPTPIRVMSAVDLLASDPPPRRWLVEGMIPDATVTLLTGDGGVGKSLLAMQLAVAVAAGADWIGSLPTPGGALYISAEDDNDEVSRRLSDIVAGTGIAKEQLRNLNVIGLADRDAILATTGKNAEVTATSLWTEILVHLSKLRPSLLIIDNLADAFAGNENIRPEARQFIGIMRQAAIRFRCAVLLLAHPSLTGIATGTGTSGSTAWSNSVRSRLYLDRPRSGQRDEEVDPNLRVLRLMKSNYGKPGLEVRLRWSLGKFGLDTGVTGYDRQAKQAKAEDVFLILLAEFSKQSRHVSAKTGTTYAPAAFAGHPLAQGVSKNEFQQAMERMLTAERVRSVESGPPSRRRSYLEATQ